MNKFEFDFKYATIEYRAECVSLPIDGSTELHITPLDGDLFETFGTRILMLQSDGSIKAEVPAPAEERDYVWAVADGLSDYYNNQHNIN